MAKTFDVSERYSDGASLLPLVYSPKTTKKKGLIGIVPHYSEKEISKKLIGHLPVKFIDVMRTVDQVEDFIDEICECEFIFSSSLHGIIVAELYGINTGAYRCTENFPGGDFKFHDYYLSTDRIKYLPMGKVKTRLDKVNSNKNTKEIMKYNPRFIARPISESEILGTMKPLPMIKTRLLESYPECLAPYLEKLINWAI
jgi:hypothetical protein